jgi:antitoxin component YwqK of YwqJK toxin-antitoxin module/Tfp pilus assembly protein PilF
MIRSFFSTLVIIVLLSSSAFAQRVKKPVASGDLIEKGVKEHDKGNYDNAIEAFLQVSRNDTNYALALTEVAISYLADEQYQKCISSAREGLTLNSSYGAHFYLSLGSALEASGDEKQAIVVLEEAIEAYPKNHLMYFNKATTLHKMEEWQQALDHYKLALMINPSHASSHLKLGYLAAGENKLTESLLSFNAFLMFEPVSDRAREVVDFMEKLAIASQSNNPKGLTLSKTGDNFAAVEKILQSRIALTDKDYKPKMKMMRNMTRQNYALLKHLEFDATDKGWWMQLYVPFFTRLIRSDYFTSMAYIELAVFKDEDPKISKELGKRTVESRAFLDWGANAYPKSLVDRTTEFDGKKQRISHWNGRTGELDAIGLENVSGDRNGYWEFFYSNGTLQSKGNHNDDGKKTGQWLYYHPNGQLKDVAEYDDDEPHGAYSSFSDHGVMVQEGQYEEGELAGVVKEYFPTGGLFRTSTYTDGDLEGLMTVFHRNGEKHYEIPYEDNKIQGTMTTYHENGTHKTVTAYSSDKKDGIHREYFANGQLDSEIEYSGDDAEGAWASYYQTGQLKRKGQTSNNVAIGEWLSYYEDSILRNETIYDDEGNLNGSLINYDRDGKRHYQMIYAKGDVESYTYYTKAGESLQEGKKVGKELDFKGFWPHGTKHLEGKYIGGKKYGVWKYYDHNGVLTTEEVYKRDELHGISKEYYPTGQIKGETKYSNGIAKGLTIDYYYDGTVEREGWNRDNEWQGDWHFYYQDGTPSSHRYYINSQLNGMQEYFGVGGALNETKKYERNNLLESVFYSANGEIRERVELPNSTGPYTSHHTNGNIYFTGHYKDGNANGKYTWDYFDGTKMTDGQYNDDDRDGVWTWYHEGGQVDTKGFYRGGKRDSTWLGFHENGNPSQIREYYQGETHGTWQYYYENGELELEREYYYGEAHGAAIYYSPDGAMQHTRYYDYGRLIGYSYHGTDGKLMDTITIENETAVVKTYFKNGTLATEWERENGWLKGRYAKYYSTGQVHEEYTYQNNDINGPKKVYYKNGQLKADEHYLMDNRHGRCIYYGTAGQLQKELNYKHDTLHGESRYYDREGRLKRILIYDDGIVIEEREL